MTSVAKYTSTQKDVTISLLMQCLCFTTTKPVYSFPTSVTDFLPLVSQVRILICPVLC